MNVYMVFRILLGIIASFFILYFLVNYAGIYTEMQENAQCMIVIRNFRKAAEDVYLSGNGVVFDDFSKLECDIMFNGDVKPAAIWSTAGQQNTRTPMLFVPGEKLLIERKSLDYGWMRFDFVEALPEMTIIFNPLEVNDDVKGLVNSIADLFPDTTGSEPKIRFGFCDGGTIIRPCSGGASFCEGFRFFTHVDSLGAPMSECSSAGYGQTLVKISNSCSNTVSNGVCIAPPGPNGVGYAYINGSAGSYVYKISFSGSHNNNPLDLVALITGADRSNAYGSVADSLYIYENDMLRQELELMTDIMWHRSSLISQGLPIQPALYTENSECRSLHSAFMVSLEAINAIVSDEVYYNSPSSVAGLLAELANADSIHQDIVSKGCDYRAE